MLAFLLQLSEDVVLIRAIRDSNLPKFMEEDVVLFEGIVGDLFPNVAITDQACRPFMSCTCCSCCRPPVCAPLPAHTQSCVPGAHAHAYVLNMWEVRICCV